MLAHRGRLVCGPEDIQGQGTERRAKARQRNLVDRGAGSLGEEQGDLLAAAATLAGSHARAGEPLDLVLVARPVAQHGVETPGRHLGRLPLEIAWRLDLERLASRDFLALADVDLETSSVDEGAEPL